MGTKTYTHFKTLSTLLPEQAMHISVIPTQDGQCYIRRDSNISSIMSNTLLSSALNQNVIFVHFQRVLELKGILWTSYTQVL